MVGKILMVCLFILIGIMLSLGKWSFLISGFNTMSKEEKEQYDVMSLCKFMGKIMFVVAFSIALFILSDILMIPILLNIGVVIIISSVIFAIIYTNIGDRFEKKKWGCRTKTFIHNIVFKKIKINTIYYSIYS